MMRMVMTGLLLMTACAAPAPAPAASIPDQVWTGTLHCGPMSDLVHIPLTQMIELRVQGGIARFERHVRLPDTSIETEYVERVQGALADDGKIVLQGDGQSRTGSYRSEYRGALGSNGRAHFEGVQHWRFERHPPVERPCDIDLQRRV